jgi:hypothetical protein
MVKNELVRRKIEFFVSIPPPATVQLEGDGITGNTTAIFRIFCCGFFEGGEDGDESHHPFY